MAVTAEEIQVLVTAEVDRALKDFQKIDKSVQKAESRFKKFGQTASKVGKTLTKTVTLPILAAGAATLKFAIDAQETAAKFNTAFAGIEEQAAITAEALAENYGLARQESEKLLAGTGDLLKGFGATASEALGLSNEVQELAVDLASYNNLAGGAAQASDIVTKALLGERESLTTLGVKISEADLKTELLRRGQEKLTGQAKLLARAEATLALITEQSGDAQGDFGRTSESAANQIRILRANAIDAATGLGKELLPAFTKVVGIVSGAIENFSQLDDNVKRIILVSAGLAAAVGPLTAAFGALAANPAFAAIALTGAAVAGIAGVVGESKKLAKDYETLFESEEKSTGNIQADLEAVNNLLEQNKKFYEDIVFFNREVGGLTEEQVRKQLASNEIVSDQIKLENKRREILLKIQAEERKAFEAGKQALEDQRELEKEAANKKIEEAKEVLDARKAFEDQFRLAIFQQSGNRLAILEFERQEAIKKAKELGASTILIQKFVEGEVAKIQDEARAEREAKRQEELAKMNALKEEELAQEKANEAVRRSFFISRLSQEQQQAVALNDRIEELREAGVSEIELEKYKEEEKTRITAEETAKRKALIVQNLKAITSVTSTLLNQLAGINTDFYNSVKDNEEEATEEKKKQARKAFEIAKAANLAQTLIATATGAIEAYKALAGIPFVGPALGIAAAAALTGFGLQKANQIRAQKPAFQEGTNAEGFRVPEGFPNDSFNIGVSSGEDVNVTQSDEAGLGGESDIRQINLNIDGRTYGRIIFDLSKNKEVQLDSRAIVVT